MPSKRTAKNRYERGIYKSYSFKDHDPILDAIDTVHTLAGRPTFKKLSEDSGVSVTTLGNWRSRKTKQPRSAGVEAVLRAMGAERAVIYSGQVVRYGGTRPRLKVLSGGKSSAA
jgi:hypothetical protein